jgi:hypothetical protein
MHGDDLAYGTSLEEALARLVGERVELPELAVGVESGRGRETAAAAAPAAPPPGGTPAEPRAEAPTEAQIEAEREPLPEDLRALAREADRAFERYLELQAERRFTEAAVELERLGQILERLAATEPAEPPETP